MGRSDDLYNQAQKCSYNDSNLCFADEDYRRNCNIPRCCGVCPKNLDCDNICDNLKNNSY
jgi:hypothetical protein